MRRVFFSTAVVLIVSGCTPRPPAGAQVPADTASVMRDSVIVPGAHPAPPDLVAEGRLVLAGEARFDTVTVGEAGVLRSIDAQQLDAARRAVASGIYLGDPFRVLRFAPAPGRPAAADLIREVPVGSPAFTELVIRLDGEGRAPVLRFEHAAPMSDDAERRMPSAIAIELMPDDAGGYGHARLLLGGRDWSEQPSEPLPEMDWRTYAHRIGVVIARDVVQLAVDGNAVLEERISIHGPAAAPRLVAETAAAGADVLVLQWTAVLE